MAARVPKFTGRYAVGTAEAVIKARQVDETIIDELALDQSHVRETGLQLQCRSTTYPGCDCKIAELGLLNPIDCSRTHSLIGNPPITRWCDEIVSQMIGVEYLLLWSEFSRASAMSLLGRWPSTEQIKRLSSRTSSTQFPTKTSRAKVTLVPCRWLNGTKVLKFELAPKSISVTELLRRLPPNRRCA